MKLATIALMLAMALGSACSRDKGPVAGPKRLQAVVTIFPLYDFCRQIGGDRVEVSLLLPPGVEPGTMATGGMEMRGPVAVTTMASTRTSGSARSTRRS